MDKGTLIYLDPNDVYDIKWDPVWGCKGRCPYCNARNEAKLVSSYVRNYQHDYRYIAKREYDYMKSQGIIIDQQEFADRLKHFVPTFIQNAFHEKLPKKPMIILVGVMTDINYWERKWMTEVIHKIKQCPQHIFRFLTKRPEVYSRYSFPKNCWLGVSVNKNNELHKLDFSCENNVKYIQIMPILEKIDVRHIPYKGVSWISVGQESGDREEKVIPKREWIKSIADCCRTNNIPLYLVDGLRDIYPEKIKEFHKEHYAFKKGKEVNK